MMTTEEAKVAMREGASVQMWDESWKIVGLMFRMAGDKYLASAEITDETGYSAIVPVVKLTLEEGLPKRAMDRSELDEMIYALEEEVAAFVEVARAEHRTAQEKIHDVIRMTLMIDKYYLDAKRYGTPFGDGGENEDPQGTEYGRIYGYEEI